jgi:hypothetical protein
MISETYISLAPTICITCLNIGGNFHCSHRTLCVCCVKAKCDYIGFVVLIAVVMKTTVFWVATQCSPLKVN